MGINSAVAQQQVDNLDTAKPYRVRLWYSVPEVAFMSTNQCILDVFWTLVGSSVNLRVLGATPYLRTSTNGEFVELVTDAFQPPAESVTLSLRYSCYNIVRGPYHVVVDDVSIEAA